MGSVPVCSFLKPQGDDDLSTIDTRKRHRSKDLFQTISDAVATVAGELAGHDHHRGHKGSSHRGRPGQWGSFDGADGHPGGSVVGSADELLDGEIVPAGAGQGGATGGAGGGLVYGRSASVEETWVLAKRVVELKHALLEARQAQKGAILAVEDKCAGLREQLRLEQERRVRTAPPLRRRSLPPAPPCVFFSTCIRWKTDSALHLDAPAAQEAENMRAIIEGALFVVHTPLKKKARGGIALRALRCTLR